MADMGYDVSDYTDIDPLFGTLADFDAMLAEAHRLGLKVILDQVLNHCEHRASVLQESRTSRDNAKADWFVWAEPKRDGTPPNNWLSVLRRPGLGLGAAAPPVLSAQLPRRAARLELPQPEVQDWLLEQMRFWLERGVDGFRLDTVNFYFHDKLLRDNPADYRRRDRPHWNPYEMQYHCSRRTSRRTSSSSSGCARCSTSTRRARSSARWARPTTRSG
jgi:alpha-glucosidase